MSGLCINFIQEQFTKKTNINNVLNNIHYIDASKGYIIKNEEGVRLYCIIEHMKKNNINITLDKIQLFLKEFQKKYAPKKIIDELDNDAFKFKKEIDKIIFDNLKSKFTYLFMITVFICIDYFDYIKTKKYLFIIIILTAILGICSYVYSINYIDKEWRLNNILINIINDILNKNLDFNKICIYNDGSPSILELFKAMMLNIDIQIFKNENKIEHKIESKVECREDKENKVEDKQEDKVEDKEENKEEDKEENKEEDKEENKEENKEEDKEENKEEIKEEDKEENKEEIKEEISIEVVGEVEKEQPVQVEILIQEQNDEIKNEINIENKIEKKTKVKKERVVKPKIQKNQTKKSGKK
jgi:flagellar biosynthesis GTPase FlhF